MKNGMTVTQFLSGRELEVFTMIKAGLSTAEIIRRMGLKAKTIETYCCRLQRKLSLKSMHELRVFALTGANADVKNRQSLVGWVEDFPVLIEANDRDLPAPFLDICTVYTKSYHDKMKKVRITVEELHDE